MNILQFLTPKSQVAYLLDTFTVRQALEKMRYHGYSSIPVIDAEGAYVSTVSEGDFLWHLVDSGSSDRRDLERVRLCEILDQGEDKNPPVTVDIPLSVIYSRIARQNFVPVTDDRGSFVGIITRRKILLHLLEEEENKAYG